MVSLSTPTAVLDVGRFEGFYRETCPVVVDVIELGTLSHVGTSQRDPIDGGDVDQVQRFGYTQRDSYGTRELKEGEMRCLIQD